MVTQIEIPPSRRWVSKLIACGSWLRKLYPAWRTWFQHSTCCDYADTLLQRNGSGDREKARSLLDESLAISSELGMRPLMERVLSRREILGA